MAYWLSDPNEPGKSWGPFETREELERQQEILRDIADWNRRAMQKIRERHPELFEENAK